MFEYCPECTKGLCYCPGGHGFLLYASETCPACELAAENLLLKDSLRFYRGQERSGPES
jgi:hypothetical protein